MEKMRWDYGSRKPSDDEARAIRFWAEDLADRYGMNADWIAEVLNATIPLSPVWNKATIGNEGTTRLRRFRPCLIEALEVFPPDEVVDLFSDEDGNVTPEKLNELQSAEEAFRAIRVSPLPLQRLDELAERAPTDPKNLLAKFVDFLESERGTFLRWGHFVDLFPESTWLSWVFLSWDISYAEIRHDGIAPHEDAVTHPDAIDLPHLWSADSIFQLGEPGVRKAGTINARNMRDMIAETFDKKSERPKIKPPAENAGVDPALDFKKIAAIMREKLEPEESRFSSKLSFSGDADLKQKIENLKKDKEFQDKENELRESIFLFIKKSLSLFTTTIAKRSTSESESAGDQLRDAIWSLIVSSFDGGQLDVILGKSLRYFGVHEVLPKGTRFSYENPCIRIFQTLSFFSLDISNQIMGGVRTTMQPLLDEVVSENDQDAFFRFPNCTYYQARYCLQVAGNDIQEAIKAFMPIKEKWRDVINKEKKRLQYASSEAEKRQSELRDALLDTQAMERLLGLKGFFIRPEDTIRYEKKRKRSYGFWEDDFSAYHPVNPQSEILDFSTALQKATMRLLCEAQKSKVNDGGVSEETIIRTIYTDEKEKQEQLAKLFPKAGKKTWRIDSAVFSENLAWQKGFIYSFKIGDEREDKVYYAINYEFETTDLRKKRKIQDQQKEKATNVASDEQNNPKQAAKKPTPKKNTPRVSPRADKKGSKPPTRRAR